jgi:anti-sigma regulatory factor (Ser/Thr protein kinase)
MNAEKPSSHIIFRATVMSRKKYLPAVCGLVRDYALLEGLTAEEAGHFEIVTEEACLNVIQHAFEDKPTNILMSSSRPVPQGLWSPWRTGDCRWTGKR